MTIPHPDFYTNQTIVSGMTFANSEVPVSSPSETSSNSPTGLNDSGMLNGMDLQQSGLNGLDDGLLDPKSGKVKKSSLSSAERRATHNAIERARRESLNGRFMALAEALPSMAHVKRPSKSIIVNKSLEYINESLLRERYLAKENLDLRREVDELRQRLGMPPLPPPPPHLVSALHAQQPQPRSPSLGAAMVAPSPPVIVSGQIAVPAQATGVSAAEFAAAIQAQNQAAAQAGYRGQMPPLLTQRGQNIHFGLAGPHQLFHDPAHGITTAALLSPATFHQTPQAHPFDNPATAQLYSTTGQLFGAGPMLSAPVLVSHPNGANSAGIFDGSFGGVSIKAESDDEKSRDPKKSPSAAGSEALKSPNPSSTPDSTSSFISASPPVSVAQQQQQIAASLGIDFNASSHQNGIWGVKSQSSDDVLSSSVSSEGSRRGSIPQPQPNWYGLSLEANNSSAYSLFA